MESGGHWLGTYTFVLSCCMQLLDCFKRLLYRGIYIRRVKEIRFDLV